jgi:hypothetical protein
VHVVAQEVCFKSGEYPDPLLYTDILVDVWKGHIKSTLIDAFKKSSESNVVVHKEPSMKVVVGKSFKEEALHIVGLTNNITISSKHNTAMCLGECFQHPTQGAMKAYARSHLQFPTATTASGFARATVEPFIVAYWACPETLDTSKANCKATLVESSVKIGTVTYKIGIPTITNFKPLSEGDEIVVLKVSSVAAEPEVQPDAKRHKSAPTSKGGKKGKGKGRGKASK